MLSRSRFYSHNEITHRERKKNTNWKWGKKKQQQQSKSGAEAGTLQQNKNTRIIKRDYYYAFVIHIKWIAINGANEISFSLSLELASVLNVFIWLNCSLCGIHRVHARHIHTILFAFVIRFYTIRLYSFPFFLLSDSIFIALIMHTAIAIWV